MEKPNQPLGVVVLGATGSVGRQTLEVIAAYPDHFRVIGLAAHENVGLMRELIQRFRPEVVALTNPEKAQELKLGFPEKYPTRVESGPDSLLELATLKSVSVVVAAIVGQAGLSSVVAAVQAGKRVALANKESLVMAGQLILKQAEQSRAVLIPVDSEHAAVHQMITSLPRDAVRRIILTASGGPFLGYTPDQLQRVTAAEALHHPRWDMGAKISIDSATLMNKGFEVIEAHWLFGMPLSAVGVVIHPESVIHALVESVDGAMLAQMANPDMRGPIAYALGFPERLDVPVRIKDFSILNLTVQERLTFRELDQKTFPAVEICQEALRRGGRVPAALAVADEVAVAEFLQGHLRFTEITEILQEVVQKVVSGKAETLTDVLEAGREGRELAQEMMVRRRRIGHE